MPESEHTGIEPSHHAPLSFIREDDRESKAVDWRSRDLVVEVPRIILAAKCQHLEREAIACSDYSLYVKTLSTTIMDPSFRTPTEP
jgi:hypothetical protein